jgi:hypothetical protein
MTEYQSVSMIFIRCGGHFGSFCVVDRKGRSCNEGKKANQGHEKMLEEHDLSGEEVLVPAKENLHTMK